MNYWWGRQLIAKKNTWFKYGTVVSIISDYDDLHGLFHGTRICQDAELEKHNVGEVYHSRHVCKFEDFYNIGLYQGIAQFLDSVED